MTSQNVVSIACTIVSLFCIISSIWLWHKDTQTAKANDTGWVVLILLKCQILTFANDIHKAVPETEDQAKVFAAQEATCYEIADEITRAIEEAYSTDKAQESAQIETVKQLISELSSFNLNSKVSIMSGTAGKIDCIISNADDTETTIIQRNHLAD